MLSAALMALALLAQPAPALAARDDGAPSMPVVSDDPVREELDDLALRHADALDGGRALCVDCSKRALRARKAALRQSYLTAASADERAAAALAGLCASPGYERAATLADLHARLVDSRARVAALRAHIDRPRPYTALGYQPLFPKEEAGRSMPSRHCFSAAAIAVAAWHCCPPLGMLMAALAVLIALSRVLSGVHYISDVVAGLAFGCGCALVLWQAYALAVQALAG